MALTGAQIVAEARKFLGVPYEYGGTTTAGLDCSGLVQLVLTKLGVPNVPRTSEDQWDWVTRIPESQAGPGDLIFFTGSPIDPPPGHVGIIVSTNPPLMLDALETGTNVRIEPWSDAGEPTGFGKVPTATVTTSDQSSSGSGGSWLGFLTDPISAASDMLKIVEFLINPLSWLRIIAGFAGFLFLGAGLFMMAKAA